MDKQYNYTAIEQKFLEHWDNNPRNNTGKPTYYCLDMFPYPSASGLHVGHWRGYVISDVISRQKLLQGFDVLHPMGFDAFGLPTENFAIKNKIHPAKVTADAVENYTRQLKDIGAVYNWDKTLSTTDPDYYKWTQWIFLKMFEQGLAYEKEMPLNWCPTCKIVKSNEEVKDGGLCDRCENPTTKKMLRQWMLKITEYAEPLLQDLDKLNWSPKIKKMQADWIGKSEGATVTFAMDSDARVSNDDASQANISVFTTRPDTLFGSTFMLLAPEHPILSSIVTPEQRAAVQAYVDATGIKSNVDRMSSKDKTGVFTGRYCINPVTGEKMPIWVADYVLFDYGTGAVMAVPGHDERDNLFARTFGLPIVQVIANDKAEPAIDVQVEAYSGPGVLINSGQFDGQDIATAKAGIIDLLEAQGNGTRETNYKLRDWVFSRQRYWGEPIPLVHCDSCGIVGVPEDQLPVLLPETESYQPTDTGESPLADIPEFVNTTCPKCGGAAKRETNTMPQWAGSSWYFLRYPDHANTEQLASKEALQYLPVDMYIGGIEHAVLHLLYARFYTKFLKDIGAVEFDEPFTRLFNQGMITKKPVNPQTGETIEDAPAVKMSKSLGNVVSPDDVIAKYGRDTLRMYMLFMGPAELDVEWNDSSVEGVYRYLNRLYKLVQAYKDTNVEHADLTFLRHKLVQDISARMDDFTFNTAISGFMEYTNKLTDAAKAHGGLNRDVLETLVILIAPFAPFIASELWEDLGHSSDLFAQSWPTFDPAKTVQDTVEIALQINGKVRKTLSIDVNMDKESVLAQAKEALDIVGQETKKEIYVPGKIVNIVM